jgi:hypothetical protein
VGVAEGRRVFVAEGAVIGAEGEAVTDVPHEVRKMARRMYNDG